MTTTPIVLMGYFNPILSYGVDRFCADAAAAGVDGLIVVDLPPRKPTCSRRRARHGLDFIRLARRPPTTRGCRWCSAAASGFVYYVSITGITGTRSATGARPGGRPSPRIAPRDRPAGRGRLRHAHAGPGGRGRAASPTGGGRLRADRDARAGSTRLATPGLAQRTRAGQVRALAVLSAPRRCRRTLA